MAAGSGQLKSGFMSFFAMRCLAHACCLSAWWPCTPFSLSWLPESKQIKRLFFKPALLFNAIYSQEEWGNMHTHMHKHTLHALTTDLLNVCTFNTVFFVFLFSPNAVIHLHSRASIFKPGVIHTMYYHAKVVFYVKARKVVNLTPLLLQTLMFWRFHTHKLTHKLQDLFVMMWFREALLCDKDNITVSWYEVVNIVIRWSQRGPRKSTCLPLWRGMCTCLHTLTLFF